MKKLILTCLGLFTAAVMSVGFSYENSEEMESEFEDAGFASPVFSNRQDCRAMIMNNAGLCRSYDCRGALLRVLTYCGSGDCRAFAMGGIASYCQTRDCRAVIYRNVGLCDSDNCRAVVYRNYGLCR